MCSGLARASGRSCCRARASAERRLPSSTAARFGWSAVPAVTAHRLIAGYGLASAPYFSPDGATIAFSANYDANTNVYVVPAGGGEPRRLTFHPSADIVTGWTRDGSRIVFRSLRNSATDAAQLYTISPNGGVATMLPLPDAQGGSFSPDGTHFAYVPNGQWEPYWQGYRGGQVTPIWIANLADSSVQRILTGTTELSRSDVDRRSDLLPFRSQRPVYALRIRPAQPQSRRSWWKTIAGAFVSASANDGTIVYSQLDAIHLFDPATRSDRRVSISIAADMAQVRPHWLPIEKEIQNAAISPSGVRAVFEAHGDILTTAAEHGDARNLPRRPGSPSAIRRGRPTGSGWPIFPMRRVSIRCA